MNTQDLRIVSRVATVLSISTVANEFHLAAGTVSKKIQILEANIGIQIFDRTTRSIRVTDEGRVFLDKSRGVVAAADEALAAVDDSGGRVRGHLKISVPKCIGQVDLGACINAFLCAYPDVNVHVDFSSRYVNLQEEGYDLAIRTGELSDSTLMTRRLTDDPQVIVAAPSYLKAHGTPSRPQDLESHSCLVLGDQCRWKFMGKSSAHVARVGGRMSCNDASQLLRAALDGTGVIRTSRAMVAEAISNGQLVEILKGYDASPDAAVRAVYPHTKYVAPRLRAFIDFVADWVRRCETPPEGPTASGSSAAAGSAARVAKKSARAPVARASKKSASAPARKRRASTKGSRVKAPRGDGAAKA